MIVPSEAAGEAVRAAIRWMDDKEWWQEFHALLWGRKSEPAEAWDMLQDSEECQAISAGKGDLAVFFGHTAPLPKVGNVEGGSVSEALLLYWWKYAEAAGYDIVQRQELGLDEDLGTFDRALTLQTLKAELERLSLPWLNTTWTLQTRILALLEAATEPLSWKDITTLLHSRDSDPTTAQLQTRQADVRDKGRKLLDFIESTKGGVKIKRKGAGLVTKKGKGYVRLW